MTAKPPAKPVPDGYHALTPYLCVKGAAAALDFYALAFGAREVMRLEQPDGRVGHAEMKIGDSHFMLADEFPEMGHLGPRTIGGTPVSLLLYVDDVDEVFARALEAGATEKRAVADQFYGDRNGVLEDPFGHVWSIATHKEDLTPEELQRRLREM